MAKNKQQKPLTLRDLKEKDDQVWIRIAPARAKEMYDATILTIALDSGDKNVKIPSSWLATNVCLQCSFQQATSATLLKTSIASGKIELISNEDALRQTSVAGYDKELKRVTTMIAGQSDSVELTVAQTVPASSLGKTTLDTAITNSLNQSQTAPASQEVKQKQKKKKKKKKVSSQAGQLIERIKAAASSSDSQNEPEVVNTINALGAVLTKFDYTEISSSAVASGMNSVVEICVKRIIEKKAGVAFTPSE